MSDGDEVGHGPEAGSGTFGWLHQPVHGFDEGVAAVIQHAAHDRFEVGAGMGCPSIAAGCRRAAALVFVVLWSAAYAQPPPSAPAGTAASAPTPLTGLSASSTHKAQAAITSFVKAHAATDRSVQNLGWDCMAAAALAEAGEAPARDRLAALAGSVAALVVRDPVDKRARGWPAPLSSPKCSNRGFDAFGDGSCNDPDTVYAFQTGLSVACLAQASRLAGRPEWLPMATEAVDYWRKLQLSTSKLCDGCTYFATSNHANDARRYVRNMNMFVAFGAAVLGKAKDDRTLTDLAERALRADMAEARRGSRGYLGSLDPQWQARASEKDRIEDHSAAVAIVALQMGQLLGMKDAASHGLEVWRNWAGCDNDRCRTAGCGYWAGNAKHCQGTFTATHCAFRHVDGLAARQCQVYVDKVGRLPSMAVWSLLLGERFRQ